ncbi:hypothetical protein N9K11_00790 [bacterium]|nr:hypothetical protein [Flavobacteriaceae bacterium]MDA9073538.1 hypothetical protein [bacterium]MDA9328163.1 hypothetical protein [Flavobacteriaceae bacterium]MDB4025563.1 hypothetical protein [Flavobacteriaceae bacterium]MDB4192245.1 hypothetical protein [Flavobacteriaceae bacterium]
MKKHLLFFAILIAYGCTESDLTFNPVVANSDGAPELVQTFGGSKNDVAKSVVATLDGGFAVLGYTQSMDGDVIGKTTENYDFWVLKFNSDALLEWNKTYGGSGDDRGNSLIETSDGGFALLGYTDSVDGDVTTNNGNRDFWVVKIDAFGALTWQKSIGYAGADEGMSIIETSDNHFILSGVLDVSASGGEGNFGRLSTRHAGGDYWSIKITQTGGVVWSRFYGGSFTDNPAGVLETASNNLIIVGGSDSNDVDITNNKGSYDFWVVKSTKDGDIIWEKSFGGSEIDEARGIVSSGDGNHVIVGDTRSNEQDVSLNNGAADLWLVKISDDGDVLWNSSIGGSNFDVGRSIDLTFDGGFIIAGSSRSFDGDVLQNQGQNDAWIVKINTFGELLWETTVGGSEIDFAYDSVQLNNGTIIAVGETNSSDGDILENKGFTDVLIIKIN